MLGFLPIQDPALITSFERVVREGHVVLDGAHSHHVANTDFLCAMCSSYKSVVLARGHREVVVSEVHNLIGTLHANFEAANIG